jgi:hypothetical protein
MAWHKVGAAAAAVILEATIGEVAGCAECQSGKTLR